MTCPLVVIFEAVGYLGRLRLRLLVRPKSHYACPLLSLILPEMAWRRLDRLKL